MADPVETLQPHVLIYPLPAQGHVNSMLKLAELLCLSDFHVTFLVSDHTHDRLLRHTDVHKRFKHYPKFRFQTFCDGIPAESARSGNDFLTELIVSLKTVIKQFFRELLFRSNCLSSETNRPVTCMITDGVLSFAIDIAEEMGIPIIYFRTISACAFWAYFCIPQLIEAGELPFKGFDFEIKRGSDCGRTVRDDEGKGVRGRVDPTRRGPRSPCRYSGWNSILENIVAGVPMICWPYFVDQPVKSRFVGEVWKLGIDMKDTCDRDIVEKMVKDLMEVRKSELVQSANRMAELAGKSHW